MTGSAAPGSHELHSSIANCADVASTHDNCEVRCGSYLQRDGAALRAILRVRLRWIGPACLRGKRILLLQFRQLFYANGWQRPRLLGRSPCGGLPVIVRLDAAFYS
jgi:hypothetical protein